jgi:hypothetical protein
MTTFRVDLTEGEVIETNEAVELAAKEERAVVADFAPAAVEEDATTDEERRQRLQKRLRVLADAMNEVEHGSPAHRELKRLHHEVLEKLRALPGGDGDREKGFPGEDFSEQTPGRYFGVEDVERIAAEDSGTLSEEQKADAELHAELKRQAHAEHFGEDDPNATDEEMWASLSRTWGLEDK